MFKFFKKKNKKIGLCLAGGGTRGFAHLGVIKALNEYGIEFDMIAGTSVGSLVGVLYASNLSFNDMCAIAKKVEPKEIKKSKFGFMPSKTDGLQEFIKENVPYEKLEDLPKKMFVVAVDLKTGSECDFEKGEIKPIVAGSCAVPAVFLPVDYENYRLIDGGVMNNIPANVLKENGCDIVITIDVNSTRGGGTSSEKLLDMIGASLGIMMKNNSNAGYQYSDIIIKPDIKEFKSTKVDGSDKMIEEGYIAAIKKMPEIMQLLGRKK